MFSTYECLVPPLRVRLWNAGQKRETLCLCSEKMKRNLYALVS
jgi:hypothetical protein